MQENWKVAAIIFMMGLQAASDWGGLRGRGVWAVFQQVVKFTAFKYEDASKLAVFQN
jgi:hypothetical protein